MTLDLLSELEYSNMYRHSEDRFDEFVQISYSDCRKYCMIYEQKNDAIRISHVRVSDGESVKDDAYFGDGWLK